LGTFQVKLDGKPITRFRSANVQGLLVYLAMQPQRPFPRDVLATLFWPDEPDRVARTNLRQTLYQLRKVLQDSDKRERPFLLVTRQTAQFNPAGNTTLDVRHFVQALAAQDVETAVSRYHGDLLPGFTCDSLEFEDWLRRERERLHGLALDALGQWTDRLIARHDFGAAKAAAQRQLTLEPWREAGHRQLMLALALDGNRQAALAQFETCRQILGEELGVEPETATAELAGRIAAGDSVRSSLARRMHNLPAPITPYFGRQEEQAMLQQRFRDPDYRLMTLVGEGGIGKSRLSLEVAWTQREQFADGVWFVPLAGVQGPPANGSGNLSPAARMRLQDDIATAIAEAMGLPVGGRESPGKQLLTLLRDRQTLLLLDNFEHLLAGADLVINLLQQSPQVFVICTSREPLNYVAEWVFPLERLPLPSRSLDDPHLSESAGPFDATTSPAVQLFVDRAQRANGRFALTTENQAQVVQLCRLVAGLPLALELAAALLRRHSLPQLIKAIEHSLDTLTTRRRDIPPRHRSMRAVFAGSWALLDADEQALFAGLSVFRGGFSPAAAHRVTGAQLWQLQALQEKSLLQAHGVDRFWLHELLRQYAAEQLDVSGRTTDIANRHSAHYLDGIIELAADLNGETPQVAAQQIAKELDNIRQAWQTAVNQGAVNRLLPALNTLSDFYQIRGLYREGLRLFGEAA
ncbi:MAG: BTAD domain-containing putative transcriptional regulator, partial [Anaerolineae bacterium]